mmetsp:Transcript_10294/g.25189  ORF Transcript_10294/g.25189 Transcript_10294/m.25189 type:complete len:302 (-) Transcript_10294:334-1239(-)
MLPHTLPVVIAVRHRRRPRLLLRDPLRIRLAVRRRARFHGQPPHNPAGVARRRDEPRPERVDGEGTAEAVRGVGRGGSRRRGRRRYGAGAGSGGRERHGQARLPRGRVRARVERVRDVPRGIQGVLVRRRRGGGGGIDDRRRRYHDVVVRVIPRAQQGVADAGPPPVRERRVPVRVPLLPRGAGARRRREQHKPERRGDGALLPLGRADRRRFPGRRRGGPSHALSVEHGHGLSAVVRGAPQPGRVDGRRRQRREEGRGSPPSGVRSRHGRCRVRERVFHLVLLRGGKRRGLRRDLLGRRR